MIPIWPLGLGAVIIASDTSKPKAEPFEVFPATWVGPKPPVWQATTAMPGEPEPKYGPPINITKVIVADFRPTSGDYDDVHIPSACIPIINFCTPSDIDVPLGFPKDHRPADPLLVELAQASDPMVVFAGVEVRAVKGGDYGNKFVMGDLSVFPKVCMNVGYFGEAGKTKTSDVPVVDVQGDATTASPQCAFQVNPSLPRLTVAVKGDARRLLLWMPSYKGGGLRIKVTLQYRIVL